MNPRVTGWQYRVVRDDEGGHRIAEVYTLEDGSLAWTQDPVYPWGDSFEEIKADVQNMFLALSYDPPVLYERDLFALAAEHKARKEEDD